MAYIGNNSTVSNIQKIDSLAFNSSSTTFDIRVGGVLVVVGSSTSTIISVGGVIQEPSVDYTVNGSSIIFAVAPATGLSFFGIILGSSVNIGVPADNSITNTKIAETISILKGGTGATTADAALTNLGGGAAGKAVFASATQANARTQLGLGTAAVLDVGTSTGNVVQLVTGNKLPAVDGSNLTGIQGVPTGAVFYFPSVNPPTGYLKANGALVSRTTYAALFAVISTTFSAGDGVTTFGLPDLRGEFIRGWDDGRGVDSGRALGSAQIQAIQSHTHDTPSFGGHGGSGLINSWDGTAVAGYTTSTATGGAETRPRNIALLACIKY